MFFILFIFSAIIFTLLSRLDGYFIAIPTLYSKKFLDQYYKVGFFRVSYLLSSFVSIYMVVVGAAFIKILLQWYNSKQQYQALVRENLETELKFLKSQIHPHFLFNTLNNLYALTLKKSDKAPETVLKLSELLDFMLYECNSLEIKLDREIALIKSYLELEKLRYNNDLSVQFNVGGKTSNIKIPPLLFLPLVENCFKHGIRKTIDKSWVKLSLEVKPETIILLAENSNLDGQDEKTVSANPGIGINNLKRRLEILYPGKHNLEIKKSSEIYSVKLELLK